MSQIHATLEQALRLKDADWKKITYFCYQFEPTGKWVETTWEDVVKSKIAITPENVVFAPTLGEIELPERWCVAKYKGNVYSILTPYRELNYLLDLEVGNENVFESELEARIEAYILAKQNLPATE